jgi:hypothetical protein
MFQQTVPGSGFQNKLVSNTDDWEGETSAPYMLAELSDKSNAFEL